MRKNLVPTCLIAVVTTLMLGGHALAAPATAQTLTYLDSRAWSVDNLLYGENGIAALTFCDVPILPQEPSP